MRRPDPFPLRIEFAPLVGVDLRAFGRVTPMPTAPRKPLLVNLAWVVALGLLLTVGYVASYPIAMRVIDRHDIVAYRPVQYLIDETPLADPIYWWSERCGAWTEVAWAAFHRYHDRFARREQSTDRFLESQ